MSDLVLDLEVVATPEALDAYALEGRTPPANYKSEEAIAKWQEADRVAYAKDAALNPRTGRIVCVGMGTQTDSGAWQAQAFTGAEDDLVREALEMVAKAHTLVTFNGLSFDLPYLLTRAVVLGLRIPFVSAPYLRRYTTTPHVDLFAVLSNWGQARKGDTLHGWARACGIPVTDTTTGADVAAAWAAGDVPAIADHCEADVLTTAALYDRLTTTYRI